MNSKLMRTFAAGFTEILALLEKRRVRDFVLGFLTCWTLGVLINLFTDDGIDRSEKIHRNLINRFKDLEEEQNRNYRDLMNQIDMDRQRYSCTGLTVRSEDHRNPNQATSFRVATCRLLRA